MQFLHIAVGSEEASCCAAKNSIGARRGFSVGANVNAPTRAAEKKDQVVGEDPKIVSGDLVKKEKKVKRAEARNAGQHHHQTVCELRP